jgi:hypothetical protein
MRIKGEEYADRGDDGQDEWKKINAERRRRGRALRKP